MPHFEVFETEGGVPIKGWVRGVPVDDKAIEQLRNVARLPVVHGWVSAMPDVHWGIGATVGSVIPTRGAIIPAAVGVDIGCGMMAVKTSLTAVDLPDDLASLRSEIEEAVPHGFSSAGRRHDRGSFAHATTAATKNWREIRGTYERLRKKHPALNRGKTFEQLGTLGGGNHFIEVCLDEADRVWVMLHSGSRGVGNRIGTHFIALAKKDMRRQIANLPDQDLAYFEEGAEHYDDYVEAVSWAQDFARRNRLLMMDAVLAALRRHKGVPAFQLDAQAVSCHHNYVARETHGGVELFITRKGAVRAGRGELGIIPGSMGAKSFIVRGKGSADSFESCSHGAGRLMSRGDARRRFTSEDHAEATRGVECRKDDGVLDETPGAYKPIADVMAAQSDLIDVVHELRQIVCVKG